MNIERDKFLTEFMGECYHNFLDSPNQRQCVNYELILYPYEQLNANSNFSTWGGFGKLWKFMLFKQPFWGDNAETICTYLDDYIDPDRFANLVYKYLKDKK